MIGTYGLQDWLDENEHAISSRDVREIREWADKRSAEVEQAKLDRNRAEVRALALRDLVLELAARVNELDGIHGRIEAAAAATQGPVETVIRAARALDDTRRETGRWACDPFAMVQQLGARLCDLAEAVKTLSATPGRNG